MNGEKRRALTLLLVLMILLTLAFIWGNSLLDREDSTRFSNGVLEALEPLLRLLGLPADDGHWIRKLAHFAEFGALGAELCLLFALYRPMRLRWIIRCALISLAAASVDETIQLFSDRFASVKDILLDCSGAFTGIALAYLIVCFIERRKSTE